MSFELNFTSRIFAWNKMTVMVATSWKESFLTFFPISKQYRFPWFFFYHTQKKNTNLPASIVRQVHSRSKITLRWSAIVNYRSMVPGCTCVVHFREWCIYSKRFLIELRRVFVCFYNTCPISSFTFHASTKVLDALTWVQVGRIPVFLFNSVNVTASTVNFLCSSMFANELPSTSRIR